MYIERFYELKISRITQDNMCNNKILYIRTFMNVGEHFIMGWVYNNNSYFIDMKEYEYCTKDEDKNEFYTIHELEQAEQFLVCSVLDLGRKMETLC